MSKASAKAVKAQQPKEKGNNRDLSDANKETTDKKELGHAKVTKFNRTVKRSTSDGYMKK